MLPNLCQAHSRVRLIGLGSIQCYQTYVRPIVEYASSVWDPVGEGNSVLQNKLEMVQRQAARFVYNDWRTTSSPSEMIKNLSGKV